MSKTKYNIEHKFVDGYKVVDYVDVSPYQHNDILSPVSGEVEIDLKDSNHFVVDLKNNSDPLDDSEVKIKIINSDIRERFVILFIESGSDREINWDHYQEVLFTHENKQQDQIGRVETRRLLLATFMSKKRDDGSVYFLSHRTGYFDSAMLESLLKFEIIFPTSQPPSEAHVATVEVWNYDNPSLFNTESVIIDNKSVDNFVFITVNKNEKYGYKAICYTLPPSEITGDIIADSEVHEIMIDYT